MLYTYDDIFLEPYRFDHSSLWALLTLSPSPLALSSSCHSGLSLHAMRHPLMVASLYRASISRWKALGAPCVCFTSGLSCTNHCTVGLAFSPVLRLSLGVSLLAPRLVNGSLWLAPVVLSWSACDLMPAQLPPRLELHIAGLTRWRNVYTQYASVSAAAAGQRCRLVKYIGHRHVLKHTNPLRQSR